MFRQLAAAGGGLGPDRPVLCRILFHPDNASGGLFIASMDFFFYYKRKEAEASIPAGSDR